MPQGLFGGMTDYSHQSFQDILGDFKNYLQMVQDTAVFIEDNCKKIEEYWEDKVDYDFKAIVAHSLKFYETAILEITEIIDEIQVEVKETHHKLLINLGSKAIEINHTIGEIWHRNYRLKDYGTTNFSIVESIYSETRDTAVTLMDISNLASRLKDFVGKTSAISKPITDKNSFKGEFISESRINELKLIQNTSFDLYRLIKICEEINFALKDECFLTIAILTRALIDHIPPIFGMSSFNEVTNNYKSTKSFKDSINNLNNSTRKIADSFLHTHTHERIFTKFCASKLFTRFRCSFSGGL
jgi:hypothetical protein